MKKSIKIHHVCIQTDDYEASLEFYKKLGFELVNETKDFHGRSYNSWLLLNDFYIELQTAKEGQVLQKVNPKEIEGLVHFCFYVENLEAFLKEMSFSNNVFLKKKGQNIYEVEGGKLAKIQAPESTIIEIREDFQI